MAASRQALLCAWLLLAAVGTTAGRAGPPATAAAQTADVAVRPQLQQPRRGDLLLHSLASATTSGVGYYDPAAEAAPAAAAPPSVGRLRDNSSSSSDAGHGPASRAASPKLQRHGNYEPKPPHKPLWPHWDERDAVLFALTAVTLFIAAGGGIGGGAVFVPLFIFVGGFTAAQAVALSNITILGGAVANLAVNWSKRHPFCPGRPLIDWDLILVFEPTTMLGALGGSYANKLFPAWFTSCLMAALLLVLTWKLLVRAVATFVQESRQKAQQPPHQREQQHQRWRQQHGGSDGSLAQPLLLQPGDGEGEQLPDAAGAAGGDVLHSSRRSKDAAAVAGPGLAAAWLNSVSGTEEDQLQGHEAAAADVLPVPAGLKALVVRQQPDQQLAQQQQQPDDAAAPVQQQQQQQQTETPLSASAFAVEGTPTRGCSGALRASDAAAAAAADEAVVISAYGEQLKWEHQQERRQGLLLNTKEGAPLRRRCCSASTLLCGCCSCLDPARLSLATVRAYQQQQLPWQPLLALSVLSAWVVGSDTGKATLACGSAPYWAAVLSVVPPAVLITLLARGWLLAKTAVEEAADAALEQQQQLELQGVIHWTPVNSLVYPLWCSAAGIFAGLFGVGGGIVKAPLMLALGVLPEVAAATSSTMIAFTAGSAAIVHLNFGGLVPDYAAALLVLGFVATLAGQAASARLVAALQRRSVIIFAMALLMSLASAAGVVQMGAAVSAAARGPPPLWHWGSICQRR